MVRLHFPTLSVTQRRRQTQIPINQYRTQSESLLMSGSVQYENLHPILCNPFLSVSVSVSVSGIVNTGIRNWLISAGRKWNPSITENLVTYLVSALYSSIISTVILFYYLNFWQQMGVPTKYVLLYFKT